MKDLPLHIPNTSCKAKIEYPCSWQFKVIGVDREAVLVAIKNCAEGREYKVQDSNVSSSGRYRSISFETTVVDEDHRIRLYRDLHNDPAVKVVL
ncbi:MAG: DUF493 domain-containing protein [Desulfobulbaceae bacterium]|nr:DUF493 domain-containing protein [Desulfobulbaceae bacterium]